MFTSTAVVEAVKAKDLKVGDVVQFGNFHHGFEYVTINVAQPNAFKRTQTDLGWYSNGAYMNYGNQTMFFRVVSSVVA
jgi:hypothetical protein